MKQKAVHINGYSNFNVQKNYQKENNTKKENSKEQKRRGTKMKKINTENRKTSSLSKEGYR